MDSRLLNAFHDDHFDGNYVKYESDTNFWSSENETLGLQLTETLQGILPISPTDDPSDYYKHALMEDNFTIVGDESLKQNDYLNYDVNGMPLTISPESIEIISVDPNDNCESQLDSDEDDDDLSSINDVEDEFRTYSRSTFRSRTDSSSIADYESHSSDYDDESDLEDDGLCYDDTTDLKLLGGKIENLLPINNFELNKSTVIQESVITGADDDVLEMDIDANTFDLATFITQDDLNFQKNTSVPMGGKKPVIPIQQSDIESDSDVDIETVEVEPMSSAIWKNPEEMINHSLVFENNVIMTDPSLNQEKVEKNENYAKVEPIKTFGSSSLVNCSNKNFSMIPSKRQSDLLKGKFGLGRGKNISMHRKPKATKVISIQKKVINNEVQTIPSPVQPAKSIGKNHENIIKSEPELEPEAVSVINTESTVKIENSLANNPIRRKLNLEEYKKRREDPTFIPSAQICHNKPSLPSPNKTLKQIVHQPEIVSIVKTLKDGNSPKKVLDPITEAKNKVLRLQKLKKAQQIKIIDSTVSAKVGRVTKLPLLKEIVKDTYSCKINEEAVSKKANQVYEEIIIVSTSCNTDLTIPPVLPQNLNFNSKNLTPSSRSLLKSSALLYNISNTIQKVKSVDNVKISSNSLISSIQDVVVKKAAPSPPDDSLGTCGITIVKKEKANDEEHGEDKIIMHLHKDRIRTRKFSASTQTDILPEFPPLPLPVQSPSKKEQTNRGRRKYRQNRESYTTSVEEDSARSRSRSTNSNRSRSKSSKNRYRTSNGKRYSRRKFKSRERTVSASPSSDSESDHQNRERSSEKRQRKYSTSSNRSNSDTSANSDSKHRHQSQSRSRSRTDNRRAAPSRIPERAVVQPAVEERRIVYVGRIEDETSKEDLRKKFLAYGPIRQITIHYKDTGMKYGFVTYERSQDAFQVIDNGQNDADINMYDISFGGRRAFCRASYADLDNAVSNTYQSYSHYQPVMNNKPKEDDSFEALLRKVKAKIVSTKPVNSQNKT